MVSSMSTMTRNTGAACLILLVAAVVAVGIMTDFGMVKAYRRLLAVATPEGGTLSLPASTRRLAAADRLVLQGDPTRASNARRQRAIWEAAPTNKVFFHHYLSSLLAEYESLGTNAVERYRFLAAEIETGRRIDPDNARLDFVLAAKLLEQAVESKTSVTGVTADGKARVRSEQVVKDRAKLAEAMVLLQRGLKKPVYRRYVADMLAARLAILGSPRSLSDQILRLNLASDTPMPDLPLMRNLARGAGAYAALLIGEKQAVAARPHLDAWKPLALKLTADSFALIDVLMAAAVVKEAELRVPECYEQMGMAGKADEVRAETRALAAPLVAWNVRRNAFQKDPAIRQQREDFGRHTGILAAMLLPALTEYPSEAELAPSRLIDYVLVEDLFFAVLTILMVVVMVVGVLRLRGLRKRLPDGAQTDGGQIWWKAAVRAVWCVILPVAVYFVCTRFTSMGGRLYGLPYVWPRLIMQLEVLGVAMVLLNTVLAFSRWVPVSLPAPGRARGSAVRWLVPAVLMGTAFLLPVSWITSENQTASLVAISAPMAVLLVALLGWAIAARKASRRALPAGRYERTAGMILMCGLSVLVLTLVARGQLRLEERRCVRQETLLRVDPAVGGFTVAEARLAQALRDQVLKVAK